MKRKKKNIIMILFLIIMIALLVLTSLYINKNSSNINNNFSNENRMPSGQEFGNMQNGSNTETPPEKPDGEQNKNMTEPPEKPDGTTENMNEPPEGFNKRDNKDNTSNTKFNFQYIILGLESLIISFIIVYLLMSRFNKRNIKETFKTGDKITIALLFIIILTSILTLVSIYIPKKVITDNKNNSDSNKMGEMNNTNITYTSKNEINKDTEITDENYFSTNEDENAILVSGAIDVTLNNIEINKTGDSSGGDNTSFYGINSAIMTKGGANLTIKNATITTNATGANGVFSYGGSATTNNSTSDGTTVTISDSKIVTTKDNSGGIMTTGGGIMKATNLTIETSGTSSAAIRTDRGGGTVEVDKGTYTTTGNGSPAIYSTAKVSVSNAKLISKMSEGIVIEGKNSVSINNVELIDSNTKLNGLSTTYKNIFLYQSMSGDASVGNSEFTATDSNITTNNGDTFYITNTKATINLTNNTIINNDSNGNFLRAKKDSWGNNGSNGGIVILNMNNQDANGNIVIDSISTLEMNMTSSSYEGTLNGENEAKSITLKLDLNSKIKLTADSYITKLEDEDTTYSNIDFNGYKLYVNGEAIN